MYNKSDILLNLSSDNYYIDKKTLTTFIKLWKIDAVYEDNEGESFYDDFAIERIKKGINLKAQGFSDEQIIHKLNKYHNDSPQESTQLSTTENTEVMATDNQQPELKNLTLDVSAQTLQMVAEAVAQKITVDIINTNMADKLLEAGGYKRDNEILATQIQELVESNKKLAEKVAELEQKKSFWGSFIELFKKN